MLIFWQDEATRYEDKVAQSREKNKKTTDTPSVRNPTETQLHNCNIRRGLTLDHAGSLIVSSDSESL